MTLAARLSPRLASLAAVACLAGALGGCSGEQLPPSSAVASVDLERYAGVWYEIARLPFSRQEGCRDTTATYTLRDDGEIDVENRCVRAGETSSATGRAWPVEGGGGGRLKVQFFWPFRADYWVLALDESYQYAMVGTPNRSYLWILAREPTLDAQVRAQLVARAEELGYPVAELLETPHGQAAAAP